MKTLNGNKYYERSDIAKCYTSACNALLDPSIIQSKPKNLFGFNSEFLYSADSDELDLIKHGINKLNNTISWEFSTESAINLATVEKCYQSLKTPASNKLDNKAFKAIPVENITSDCVIRYETWLSDIGIDILFSFFSDY
mgnify:CR=1 FL=1|tara:strand:- start:824 stop:1243 length:420 start_codon:yes stop_codon:yes gene_type:complete